MKFYRGHAAAPPSSLYLGIARAASPHPPHSAPLGTPFFCCIGGIDIVSADEFSVACGGSCTDSTDSSTPAEPAPSPAPEPVGEAPEPIDSTTTAPEGSCAESFPIEITSSFFPDAEGCYYQNERDVGDGQIEIIYTPSGEPDVGQLWMHPDAAEVDGVLFEGVGARSWCTKVEYVFVLHSPSRRQISVSEIGSEMTCERCERRFLSSVATPTGSAMQSNIIAFMCRIHVSLNNT